MDQVDDLQEEGSSVQGMSLSCAPTPDPHPAGDEAARAVQSWCGLLCDLACRPGNAADMRLRCQGPPAHQATWGCVRWIDPPWHRGVGTLPGLVGHAWAAR